MASSENRVCSKCSLTKPTSEYYVDTRYGKQRLYRHCKDCQHVYSNAWRERNKAKNDQYNREWRLANKDKVAKTAKRTRWKCKYGLREMSYAKLLEIQQNTCVICRNLFSSSPMIDHNHTTGKVRGLLCASCNAGIGMFKENPRLFNAAALYVEQDGHIEKT